MNNRLLAAALKYAAHGWAVFPVRAETKKPWTKNGCKDAKTDPGAIKHWWKVWPDASIGIATGSMSNLIVIDEDYDDNKGIDGRESIAEWERQHGELPETMRVITGRGGYHLYYHYTGNDIKNRAGIIDGVDIRGEGGYVIAPPSVHPNGTEYQWEESTDENTIADVDDKVLEFLQTGQRQDDQREEFKLPETIQSGSRNDTLFRLACSLQAQGLPDAAILEAVNETNLARCMPPLPDNEIQLIIKSALQYSKGELKIMDTLPVEWHEPHLAMQLDKDGLETERPAQTIANAAEAIGYDQELFRRIFFNEIAYAPYVLGSVPWRPGKGWREWDNADDSGLLGYIEQKYGLKSTEKILHGLTNVVMSRQINPIKQMLQTCHEMWDGNKHIENLLPRMLGAEKNEYTTAVMKLFMSGALMRLYHPGCKFDYMLILVAAQGIGKSTFLRFLSLNDDWYNDNFNTLDGDKALEKLRGMWIVELAELQALKRAKDSEITKAFITSRVDTYRVPYGRRTEQRPRMCVLAGTSNPVDFLTDKTGNRRFLPVTCNVQKPTFDMFADEIATKAEFVQAWGELMDEFLRNGEKLPLTLPARLQKQAMDMQTAYLEEDPSVGIIQEWLDTNTEVNRVCVMQLWREALGHLYDDPKKQDINALHVVMKNQISGWHYVGRQRAGSTYGVQRCYDRTEMIVNLDEPTPFD